MESQVTEVLPPWVPDWLAKEIANLGLDVVLDLTYYATVAYTTPSFYNEIKGMCDASGANYLKARNI